MEKIPLREELIRTLKVYAECDMSLSRTASRVYRHRNGVDSQLKMIENLTGINPKTFYGLAKLLQIYTDAFEIHKS